MKLFRLSSLLAVVAIACSAAAYAVTDCVVAAWQGVKDFAHAVAVKVSAAFAEADATKTTASLRGFVVHKAHQVVQLARQRPRIEQTWRMCPSA